MKKKILIVIVIILLVILLGILSGYLYIKSKFNKMTFKPLDETDLGIEVNNDYSKVNVESVTKFVIFGSDTRDTDNMYAGRSDTIIIVVINNLDKTVNFISIPRDTYVNVPGYGMTKINHAYAYGQEQLSLKTINSNFGLDLKQYMTIDFSGLINCIDLVGGVEVSLTQDEVNYINSGVGAEDKITSAGKVLLNGKQALVHSRNRTIGNDFTRASRQRQILEALMVKLSKEDPNKILDLSDQILVNITTNMDMNMYKDMFMKLAGDRELYLKNINSVQIPSEEYGYDNMIDGIYYWGFDMDRAKQDFQKYYFGNTTQE